MHSSDDHRQDLSRRSFLLSGSGLFTSLWVASQWPSIAAAAHHAELVGADAIPARFEFFSAADGADVDAICGQIVPSGATPGAREAHAALFIDRSLATYFADMAPGYGQGLKDFQATFRSAHPRAESFAGAEPAGQLSFLMTVDRTEFFETTRTLTVLGMFAAPKYGGNYQQAGWKLMGFVDEHAFTPPFGYYDARYTGFVPYPESRS